MTEILNPVEIEQGIRAISNRIASSVKECSDRYRVFMKADLDYDRTYAHAYLNADGPAHERKYRAEIAAIQEREARDLAEVTYKHAERLSRALDAELRAMQSIGASVRSMYQTAGRGES